MTLETTSVNILNPKRVILPTVGRKVWYRPCANDLKGPMPMGVIKSGNEGGFEPLDATVIAVWSVRMVNVLVTDVVGRQFPVLSCALLQDGDEPAKDQDGKVIGRYCEWMPYQKETALANASKFVNPAAEAASAAIVGNPLAP